MPRPEYGTQAPGEREVDLDDDQGSDDDTLFNEDVDPDARVDPDDGTPPTDAEVTNESQTVKALKAQVKELNSRIGSLAQANDERLKTAEKDWQQWGEQYRQWATTQIDEAYSRGKEESEEKFLPTMSPEEKAQYFEEARANEKKRKSEVSNKRRQEADQRMQMSVALKAAIDTAIGQGVPQDILDTSSPESVLKSAMTYLNKGAKASDDESDIATLRQELKEAQDSIRRLQRDGSGASRTGTGAGSPAVRVNKQLELIDADIAKAKRQHNITALMRLKRERAALVPS